MPPLLKIALILPKAELEKPCQAMFRAFPVIRGIHRPQQGIAAHLLVKCRRDAFEAFWSQLLPNLFLVHCEPQGDERKAIDEGEFLLSKSFPRKTPSPVAPFFEICKTIAVPPR